MFGWFGGDAKFTMTFLCPSGALSKSTRTQRESLLCWKPLGKVLELSVEFLCPLEMLRQHLPQFSGSLVPAEECEVALLNKKTQP